MVAGDDLDAIAERFGVSVAEFKQRNRRHPDTMDPGQRIEITAA